MGFNIRPDSERAVLVIIKILDHYYILWIIHIRYPIIQWILIDPDTQKRDQFNDDSTWDIIEWIISDQCFRLLLHYVVPVLNFWHMLICSGGIKVYFLRE